MSTSKLIIAVLLLAQTVYSQTTTSTRILGIGVGTFIIIIAVVFSIVWCLACRNSSKPEVYSVLGLLVPAILILAFILTPRQAKSRPPLRPSPIPTLSRTSYSWSFRSLAFSFQGSTLSSKTPLPTRRQRTWPGQLLSCASRKRKLWWKDKHRLQLVVSSSLKATLILKTCSNSDHSNPLLFVLIFKKYNPSSSQACLLAFESTWEPFNREGGQGMFNLRRCYNFYNRG